jgi:hypothetical protein
MRSIFPASHRGDALPAPYTANRMLEEPPLIVRMQGHAGFMGSRSIPFIVREN